MLEQSTLYTLGFLIIVIIALQYVSFMVMKKYVKNEIGKIARVLLKNKSTMSSDNQEFNKEDNKQENNNNQDNNQDNNNHEESVDVDTPTNIENEDIDSYVNPVPSVDNDS